MQRFSMTNFIVSLIFSSLTISVAYASTTQQDEEQPVVTIEQYNNHAASSDLESLHRIQINDIAGLRQNLESAIANYVYLLWSCTQNSRASKEDRSQAYRLLRLIAVQNEMFPIKSLDRDPKKTAILQAAIENDLPHTQQLRRQDWSKPKWLNWVN